MEPSFSAEQRELETPVTRALDRALLWWLCGLLLFGPLAFGATEPWSQALQQIGAVILLLFWCLRQVLSKAAVFHSSSLFLPMSVFAAVVAGQIFFNRTAYRHADIEEAMAYLTYAILLFVGVQLFYYGQKLRLFSEIMTW